MAAGSGGDSLRILESCIAFSDAKDAMATCDGNCSGKGEDMDLSGSRNQDGDGNWTETDPLANDSYVDGVRAAKRTTRAGGSPAFAVARTAM